MGEELMTEDIIETESAEQLLTMFTIRMRGRPVTHDEAAASAQRLIASYFKNPNREPISIPPNPADDDLIITDYIREQRARGK